MAIKRETQDRRDCGVMAAGIRLGRVMCEFFRFVVRFFHGWRRKVGLISLIFALLLTGGWVRSSYVLDEMRMTFGPGDLQIGLVVSMNQQFGILMFSNGVRQKSSPKFGWTTFSVKSIRGYWGKPLEWWWHGHGFCLDEIRNPLVRLPLKAEVEFRVWLVPYWSVVIPLTLLSACLVLAMPRKSHPNKLSKPICLEGV